jgi:hypothetical protein
LDTDTEIDDSISRGWKKKVDFLVLSTQRHKACG